MNSDVIWRSVNSVNWPAINIKNYSSVWGVKYPLSLLNKNNFTHPDFNAEWIEKNIEAEEAEYIWEYMAEISIRDCEELAKALFGDQIAVIQDGRMGGWLVVTNWKSMPGEYEEANWSKRDVNNWNIFSAYVEGVNKNFIFRFLSEIYLTKFLEKV